MDRTTRKKPLTADEVAERFPHVDPAALTTWAKTALARRDSITDSRDHPSPGLPHLYRGLITGWGDERMPAAVGGHLITILDAGAAPTKTTLAGPTRDLIVASVTAYWHDLGKHEKRVTGSSYDRWRAGRPTPSDYIARSTLDFYVKGHPGFGFDGSPLERDPDQDWRIVRTFGKTERLERPLEAALRVAGLS